MPHALRSLALLALIALSACSPAQPPAGRWEGAYEDSGLLILARLEISRGGAVRVSAPNAILEAGVTTEEERRDLKAKLAESLEESWPRVAPLDLEFDGKVFRKPGGVAPQLEWSPENKTMTLVFYSGNRASVRVPLQAVAEFGEGAVTLQPLAKAK